MLLVWWLIEARSCGVGYGAGKFQDRNCSTGADIEHWSVGRPQPHRSEQCRDDIANIDEIPRLAAIPEHFDRRAATYAFAEDRDDTGIG